MTNNDKEEIKDEIVSQYYKETGERLPDHVVDNLELLSPHSLDDYARFGEFQQAVYEEPDESEAIEVAGAVTIVAMAGLGSLYLAQYIPSWPGKIVGGILMWVIVVGLLSVISEVLTEVMEWNQT